MKSCEKDVKFHMGKVGCEKTLYRVFTTSQLLHTSMMVLMRIFLCLRYSFIEYPSLGNKYYYTNKQDYCPFTTYVCIGRVAFQLHTNPLI